MQSPLSFSVRTGIPLFVAFVVYLASYAPFLKFTEDSESPYYRSPVLYRPAEWFILHTLLQSTLLQWSDLIGVRSKTELQVFYFGRGCSDPEEDFNFNIQY